MRFLPRGRADRLFAAYFAAILGLRLALLLCSQQSLNGDEASVGLMARHILERGERPLFAEGSDYNGGAALTAYVATLPIRVLGLSELSIKLVPFVFSLVALLTVYGFVRATSGDLPALGAAVVYGTAVWLLKWSFEARGAYSECQALTVLVFWALCRRSLGSERPRIRDDLLLGFLCGFGVYLLETFAAVAVTCLVFLLLRDKLSQLWRGVAAWLAGVALGSAPLLRYGRGAESLHPMPLLQGVEHAPLTLLRTLTDYLPRAMGYDNLEGFPALRFFPNGLEYLLLVCSISAFVVWRAAELRRVPGELRQRQPVQVLAAAVLLGYVGIYLLLYSMHPLAGQDARHLLFLEPPLSILAGLGLAEAWKRRAALPRAVAWGGLLLVVMAFSDRAWQAARLFEDDGVYGPLGRSDPRVADLMVAFLDGQGIARVVSEDWDLTWRIVFKTGERIAAVHAYAQLPRLLARADSPPLAVILEPGTRVGRKIGRRLERDERAEQFPVAGKAVYVVKRAPETPGRPAAPAAAKSATLEPDTYLAFGDSITEGDGSSDSGGYRTRLASKLLARFGRATVIDGGESATGSQAGVRRIGDALAQYRPACTLILYGTNDWTDDAGSRDEGVTRRSLRRIVQAVLAAGSRPFLATLPPTHVGSDPAASLARNR
jgi:hypothetical protein